MCLKSKQLLLLCLIFFAINGFQLYGQENWFSQNSGTTENLNDVAFVDSLTGWAVGNNGVIVATTNGGNDWQLQECDTHAQLESVCFVDKDNGWIAGYDGTVLKTVNGGNRWEKINFPQTGRLYSNHFISPDTGWVSGESEYIYKTVNAGESWQKQVTDANTEYILRFHSIYFINSKIGWAAGGNYYYTSGRLYKTEDGGENWEWIFLGTNIVFDINFADKNMGWLVTCGGCGDDGTTSIYQTNNMGRSWTEQFFLKKFSTFTSVFAVNQKIAWVTGWFGKIYYTENGGESWYLQNTNIKNCLSSIYFTSEKIGWAVGENGIILKSVTGGITTVKNQDHTSVQKFHLLQNYPNPFNPTTSLQYHLQQNDHVKLVIYNQNGQLVQTLVDEFQKAGSHKILWDAGDLASGIYFYQIITNKFTETKKMLLLH